MDRRETAVHRRERGRNVACSRPATRPGQQERMRLRRKHKVIQRHKVRRREQEIVVLERLRQHKTFHTVAMPHGHGIHVIDRACAGTSQAVRHPGGKHLPATFLPHRIACRAPHVQHTFNHFRAVPIVFVPYEAHTHERIADRRPTMPRAVCIRYHAVQVLVLRMIKFKRFRAQARETAVVAPVARLRCHTRNVEVVAAIRHDPRPKRHHAPTEAGQVLQGHMTSTLPRGADHDGQRRRMRHDTHILPQMLLCRVHGFCEHALILGQNTAQQLMFLDQIFIVRVESTAKRVLATHDALLWVQDGGKKRAKLAELRHVAIEKISDTLHTVKIRAVARHLPQPSILEQHARSLSQDNFP